MSGALAELVHRYTGRNPVSLRPLAGGSVARVMLVELPHGGRAVAKLGPGLEPEGWMLRYLAAHSRLPVPPVIHSDDDLLLMEYVPSGGSFGPGAQAHAAQLLAELHAVTWHSFGLDRATLIGGLPQPNTPRHLWLDFFRDQRLLAMADQALAAGRLPAEIRARLDTLAGRLDRWIVEPAQPALLHGDAWTGNLLVKDDHIAAFIDPAL